MNRRKPAAAATSSFRSSSDRSAAKVERFCTWHSYYKRLGTDVAEQAIDTFHAASGAEARQAFGSTGRSMGFGAPGRGWSDDA